MDDYNEIFKKAIDKLFNNIYPTGGIVPDPLNCRCTAGSTMPEMTDITVKKAIFSSMTPDEKIDYHESKRIMKLYGMEFDEISHI